MTRIVGFILLVLGGIGVVGTLNALFTSADLAGCTDLLAVGAISSAMFGIGVFVCRRGGKGRMP